MRRGSCVAPWLFLALAAGCAGAVPDRHPPGDGDVPPGEPPAPPVASCEGEICMVTAPDGVLLRTWVLLPATIPAGGLPALLWRSPYRTSGATAEFEAWVRELAAFHNGRGYAMVFQDVRGRGGSGGTFAVLRHEIDDGRATTAWMVTQPWSNGRIGTIGGSYDGFTALAAAVDNPHVAAVLSDDGCTDERSERIGGTFRAHTLSWLRLVETGSWLSETGQRDLVNTLDPAAMDEVVLGHVSPYWREALAQDGPGLWPTDGSLEPRYGDLCVPGLHVYSETSLWNDPIDIWRGMRDQGCSARAADQLLVVTPDPHVYHLGELGYSETPVNRLMLDFLDHHLGGRPVDLAGVPRVQYASYGETTLRPATDWPAGTGERTFWLDNPTGDPQSGVLGAGPTAGDPLPLYVDPEAMDPCALDYPVAYYASEPLETTVTVAGASRLELDVSAETPDVDVVVNLYDWNDARAGDPYLPAGWGAVRARYRDGAPARALASGEVVHLSIPFTAIAHDFHAGSRVLLSVSPGECSLLENPQTGEAVLAQTHRQAGTLRLFHDAARPALLVLPEVTR